MVVSVCREWGYLPITTDDGGIRGQHPALACMRLLPCSCWGLFRDRGRHYRKGFSQAAGTASTSHSRIIRNSSCDPAMCETRRRAGKRMGGRSWQQQAAVVGFGTARKPTTIGVCCVLMMKHRCAVSIRYRCGGVSGGFLLFERWYREAPCRSQGPPSTG